EGSVIVIRRKRGERHGDLMRVGSDGFKIVLMSEESIRGSRKSAAEICCHRIDHVFLPEEAVTAPSSEVCHGEAGDAAQALDLAPEFCFRPGIQDVETELAQFFQTGSGLELVKDGKRIEFPHGRLGPQAVEGEMELSVLDG